MHSVRIIESPGIIRIKSKVLILFWFVLLYYSRWRLDFWTISRPTSTLSSLERIIQTGPIRKSIDQNTDDDSKLIRITPTSFLPCFDSWKWFEMFLRLSHYSSFDQLYAFRSHRRDFGLSNGIFSFWKRTKNTWARWWGKKEKKFQAFLLDWS